MAKYSAKNNCMYIYVRFCHINVSLICKMLSGLKKSDAVIYRYKCLEDMNNKLTEQTKYSAKNNFIYIYVRFCHINVSLICKMLSGLKKSDA